MDDSPEQTAYQQATVLIHRNSYKFDDASVNARSSRVGPQRALPTQTEGLGLIAQLERDFFRVLGALYTAVVIFFVLLLLCFFGFNIFRSTLNLGCKIPNTSYLPTCRSEGGGNEAFDILVSLQVRLISVQEIIAGGITLPMLLDNSKDVVLDVTSIVRKSKVPSRYQLVEHLAHFWHLTDITGDDISDLLHSIDQMMDNIIALNELKIRNLKQIASLPIESLRIGSLLVAILFNAPITIEDAVHKQYLQHLNDLIAYVNTLIVISQLVEVDLKQMADIQWALRDLIVHDHKEITHSTYDARGTFWAWFGRYQGLLKDLKRHAASFQGFDAQHVWAVDLIDDVTQTLETIGSELDDLRMRTQKPTFNMAGDLQLQIASMEKGIDVLKTRSAKSRKAKQETMADVKELISVQKKGRE